MNLKTKSCIAYLLFLLGAALIQCDLSAQLTSEHNDHLMSLLEDVSDDQQPGVAVSIIEDGEIAFMQPGGLVNLETKSVADQHTIYQVDAISSQFTTLAFLHLIESGKAILTDEIHQYLPELPQYDYPITLNHVLNHTTGLNDFQIIQQLGQNHPAQTNSEAMSLLAAQEELAFQPGTEFSIFDAKTESLLMAEIIAAASEMSFANYMKLFVFEPYGLKDARFIDNEHMIILEKAKSYGVLEDAFYGIANNTSIVGPTNLWISISDISKWYQHFSPNISTELSKKIKRLDSNVLLDNGTPYHSPWGTMTIGRAYRHLERGIPKYWQYGLTSGFGANVFRFPEQDLIGIALGNNNEYNGYYAMEILTPILGDFYKKPAIIDVHQLNVIKVSNDQKANWVGDYMNYENGMIRSFVFENDTLRYGPRSIPLVPIANNTFQALMQSDDVLIFEFHEDSGKKGYFVKHGAAELLSYQAIADFEMTTIDLLSYEGKFIDSQLDLVYEITLREGQLILSNAGLDDIPLRPIKKDLFATAHYSLSNIIMHREGNTVARLEVRAPGLKKWHFEKVVEVSDHFVEPSN